VPLTQNLKIPGNLSRVGTSSIVGRSLIGRLAITLALLIVLCGCGSSIKSGRAAGTSVTPGSASPTATGSCAATVLDTLGHVITRIYHEGVESERTAAARNLIKGSVALRAAVESGDSTGARAAARALLATGHMTNLRVLRGTQTLVDVGGPALAPLRGTLIGAGGAPIGSYVASVWADSSFTIEAKSAAEGLVALRMNGRSVGGSLALGSGQLPDAGALTRNHILYQYTSFPAESYPSGGLRIYVLRSVASTAALCGSASEDTIVNTLQHVANLIYKSETGRATAGQIRRVQHNQPLLEAVARREPLATTLAIHKLLNEHIVRLRVSTEGRLLADVGGPFVLAPVSAKLELQGHTIGSFVLSIQDDEGYLRLARRLAGLNVLMYMRGTQLVKNSLGPEPGTPPASGSYRYRGRTFRVFTIHAEAFPSGPLLIRVLVPIPYLGSSTPEPSTYNYATASASRLAPSASKSSAKDSANFSTPSRSSVSVTSS